MKRITCLHALLLGVVWILAPLPVVAENWPTKEFRVIQANPGSLTKADVTYAYLLESLGNAREGYGDSIQEEYEQQQTDQQAYPKISNATAREIERWLKTVAEEYERMGFNKPHITDIGTLSGDDVFKVYVYPFRKAPASYSYICGDEKNRRIHVDSRTLDPNATGILTTKLYQDLAHELFHAVQQGYDLFEKNCNLGRWISEGTAEAVGIEMARKLYPKRKPVDPCQIGIRRYDRELHTSDNTVKGDFPCEGIPGSLDYAASSFWQFLGEYATRKGIYMATEEFSPPDFRYLHNFFRTTHPMGNYAREYAWLDKVLWKSNKDGKRQFGISLHTAYSRFIGTFASYWKPRRTINYGNTVGGGVVNEKKWMEWVFGICEEASITKNASTSLAVEIMPVASRCLKLNFDFTGRVNLTFYVAEANQGIDLDPLAISTDGGVKIIRRHPAEPHPDKLGKFSIDAKSGSPQYFIVSNVQRKDPGNTMDIVPTFSIVPELMSTSKAKAEKAPSDETSEDSKVKKELKNAWESRSWTGHASNREKSPCTRPFEYGSCGPVTEIELELLPETARLLDEVVEPTMSLERKMRVLDAIVQQGEEQVLSDMGSALMEIRKQDGWNVRITIPQIQPGFSGAIPNAHIKVEKAYNEDGSANGFWSAIGPAWVGPCGGPGLGYYPASGMVSINEYSNNVLNGTFEAKLVDQAGNSDDPVESCQSLPIATSISGSFMITNINWGQAAPELSDDEILDQTIEDTNELLPGLITQDMQDYIKEQARKERQKQEQLKQEEAAESKETSIFQQCRCNCEMETKICAANPGTECCVLCEPIFNVCKGNQKSLNAAQTPEEQAKEDSDVQAMRKQYEAYLETHGASGDMKEQMMKAFDDLKTVDEKRMLMMSIPRKEN